jgi:hypothetical protein
MGTKMGTIAINRDGVFKLDNSEYRIPRRFSERSVIGYRVLTEPPPAIHRNKQLTAEQGIITRQYLLWRAAACLIPKFQETDPKSLSMADLDCLHEWIARHHPELFGLVPSRN